MKEPNLLKKYDFIIGIDCGKNTGFSVWDVERKKFKNIESLQIHKAIFKVIDFVKSNYRVKVVVEDARQRKWFGTNSNAKLQGAGSIKRDSTIWEDFLSDFNIDFELVAPKNNVTKLTAVAFKNWTKYEGKTNEHGRDSAMLVFGRTC